jgi:hypothetical protein
MYKEILLGIAGIDVFPVVSLVLFVIVFTVMLIRVAMMDRARAARLAAMPLDGSPAALRPDDEVAR